MTVATATGDRPDTRPPLRSVALPTEHGGWALTLEPGVLGLLIAPSPAGLCIAAAAMVAFLVRTPLKIAAIDHRRGRMLGRTRLARRIAAAELVVLAALAGTAVAFAEPWFWVPGVLALPAFGIEFWYEVRSRGRRLVPELAGAVGVCSVAAMIVLADGRGSRLAAASSIILAARVATSIPYVRGQIARLHQRPSPASAAVAGDVAAIGLAALALGLTRDVWAGAVAVLAVVIMQRASSPRPVPRAVTLGLRQMAMGLGVVVATALGVYASAP